MASQSAHSERGALRRAPIRTLPWYREAAAYFRIDEALVQQAAPGPGEESGTPPPEQLRAKEAIAQRFCSPQTREALARMLETDAARLTDGERSESWRDYIFVCLNGERHGFRRMGVFDSVSRCVIPPLLADRDTVTVLDYGCGGSLFTRVLVEDHGPRVRALCADVCTYAVEFATARNRLYSPDSRGIVIDDPLSAPELPPADVVYAYTVFEHLPDSRRQIAALVKSIPPGGVLIENYAGHATDVPRMSDTTDACRHRDENLDFLAARLELLHGALPAKRNGTYARDGGDRIWVRPGGPAGPPRRIRRALRAWHHPARRLVRRLLSRRRRP